MRNVNTPIGKMDTNQIAKIAHETNRAYCASIGDASQLAWEDAPEWQRQSAINGVEFHLAGHTAGARPAPSSSHASWLDEQRRDGWAYGPVKDATLKQHPCVVSYDELPLEQKMKDYLFGAVVAAFYEAHDHAQPRDDDRAGSDQAVPRVEAPSSVSRPDVELRTIVDRWRRTADAWEAHVDEGRLAPRKRDDVDQAPDRGRGSIRNWITWLRHCARDVEVAIGGSSCK